MSEYIVNLEGELGMALAVACAGAGFAREEVVRCRDCKRFHTNTNGLDCPKLEPDGFCKWGERRGE